jgi:molybdopterin-guanine dinucleotide biosynthesis protein A
LSASAIILAGGLSSRFGQEKSLLCLAGKPLVRHVIDAVGDTVNEKIVVVSSKEQARKHEKILNPGVSILVDEADLHGSLVGAIAGFKHARGEYSVLLPCDTPLVSREILRLMLELCVNKNAAVPRWPNCNIEPLQAVYRTKTALRAAESALSKGTLNLQTVLDNMTGVRYISTLVLKQLDPELRTFFNVNTPLDLRKAEQMLKR